MKINPNWLDSCPPGWHALVGPLVEACNAEGAKIIQIKEKFGGLRMYVDGASPELRTRIVEAEEKSNYTCDQCGKPGKHVAPRGWIRTLCEEHTDHQYP